MTFFRPMAWWWVVIVWGIVGCEQNPVVSQSHDAATTAANQAVATLAGLIDEQSGALRIDHGTWVGDEVVEGRRGDRLPASIADKPVSLLVARGGPVGNSRGGLIDQVSQILDVTIQVDPVSLAIADQRAEEDVVGVAEESDAQPAEGLTATQPLTPVDAPELREFLLYGYRKGSLADDFYHDGTGYSLLSVLTRVLGFSNWIYQDGVVLLQLHAARDFPVHALVGEVSEDLFKEIHEAIRGVCGECVVEARPHLGVFSVIGRPAMLTRVGEYMSDINRTLTEQYVINVDVFSVQRELRDDVGIDFNLLFNNGGVLRLGTGRFATDPTVEPNPEEGGPASLIDYALGLAIVSPGSMFDGSRAVLNALASVGRTSVTHSSTIIAMNNREQELDLRRTDKIKVGENVVQVGDQGSLVTEVIEEFEDGLLLRVRLRTLRAGRLLLSYALELDTLIVPQPGQDTSDQALRSSVDHRKLANEITVPVGARIVFNGFERRRTVSSMSGTFVPDFWGLGGGRNDVEIVESLIVSLKTDYIDMDRFGS